MEMTPSLICSHVLIACTAEIYVMSYSTGNDLCGFRLQVYVSEGVAEQQDCRGGS